MKEDRVYLEYILQCIEAIEEYSQGSKKIFIDNSLKRGNCLAGF